MIIRLIPIITRILCLPRSTQEQLLAITPENACCFFKHWRSANSLATMSSSSWRQSCSRWHGRNGCRRWYRWWPWCLSWWCDGRVEPHPPLSPRSLYILWDEYQNGMGGRKAAQLFTKEERGSCKFKYCRRKIVWDLISLHVNAGITAHRSCDMIYAHYGEQLPVTKIINSLRRDIQRSGIPVPLRVGL